MPTKKVSFYNQIDRGIFLCFLDLCLQHNHIKYEVELFFDNVENTEKTLTAVYRMK